MAEITIYSSIGIRSAGDALFRQFEAESGHRLAVTWATAPMLVKRIESGETADLLVLSRAAIDALVRQGKIAAASAVTLAGSSVAVAVRAGAPKPDIATPDALRRTLLAAKSIAYTEPSAGGASGVYFAGLLERMGIAAAMRHKTRHPPHGGFAAALLLTGEAELAVQQTPELLHVAGTEIVGPLPGDLNLITEFTAGIVTDSRHAAAARQLIESLRTPSAKVLLRAKGLDPR